MYLSIIEKYQKFGLYKYVLPLMCIIDSHPPLIAVVDEAGLAVKCVLCSYRRELGLSEYNFIKTKVELVERLINAQTIPWTE